LGNALQLPPGLAMAVAFLATFPVFVLAAIHFSRQGLAWLLGGFRAGWPGWLAFYLETALLLLPLAAAGGLFGVGASLRADGPFRVLAILALIVLSNWLLLYVLFVYFRLLGRLAGYCTDRIATKDAGSEGREDEEVANNQP
jgi:hypothetical protein